MSAHTQQPSPSRSCPRSWPGFCGILLGLAVLLGATPAWAGNTAAGDEGGDGQVLGSEGERLELSLDVGFTAEPGAILLIYRRYPAIQDAVYGREISGETYLGRALLESRDGSRGTALAPLVDARSGDVVRLAPQPVITTIASDAWVPRGADKLTFRDPFLVPRRQNSRIGIASEFVRMGKGDTEGDTGDFYYGTAVDFTYWPMFEGTSLAIAESLRFGAGGVQGHSPELADLSTEASGLVRYLYGFAEFGLRLTPYLTVLPLLQLGLNNQGFGAGGGAALRAGSERNSHVRAGFEYSQRIGGRVYMELHHFPLADFQVWVRAAGENLPSGARWGGRIQAGVEKQVTRMIWVRAGLGAGGRRSTDAALRGFNAQLGLAFNFDTRR